MSLVCCLLDSGSFSQIKSQQKSYIFFIYCAKPVCHMQAFKAKTAWTAENSLKQYEAKTASDSAGKADHTEWNLPVKRLHFEICQWDSSWFS